MNVLVKDKITSALDSLEEALGTGIKLSADIENKVEAQGYIDYKFDDKRGINHRHIFYRIEIKRKKGENKNG